MHLSATLRLRPRLFLRLGLVMNMSLTPSPEQTEIPCSAFPKRLNSLTLCPVRVGEGASVLPKPVLSVQEDSSEPVVRHPVTDDSVVRKKSLDEVVFGGAQDAGEVPALAHAVHFGFPPNVQRPTDGGRTEAAIPLGPWRGTRRASGCGSHRHDGKKRHDDAKDHT